MKLAILMPTYNRVEPLTLAVNRIISLINQASDGFEIKLIISNNASTDCTKEYLQNISNKNIIICNHYIHSDFSVSLQRAELLVSNDFDWVWWHGDDDIIEDYVSADLIFSVIKSLENGEAVAGHLCGKDSVNLKSHKIYIDNCLKMCNEFGFISMMGPISSILIRRPILKKAFNAFRYAKYSPSSFVHSICIFEEIIDLNYALVNISIINQQNKIDHELNMRRWASELIFDRMFYTADIIYDLQKNLNIELNLNFFRAHDNSFLNILAHLLINSRKDEDVKINSLLLIIKCIYPELNIPTINQKIRDFLNNNDSFNSKLIQVEYNKILVNL